MANEYDEPLAEPKPIPAVPAPEEHGKQQKQSVNKKGRGGTKRGYGRRKNDMRKRKCSKWLELSILGTNANGIQAKRESLMSTINTFQPSVITLQETKLRKLGTFRIPGYQVFEKVRSGFGGGLLTAVDEKLLPVLISTGKKRMDLKSLWFRQKLQITI